MKIRIWGYLSHKKGFVKKLDDFDSVKGSYIPIQVIQSVDLSCLDGAQVDSNSKMANKHFG